MGAVAVQAFGGFPLKSIFAITQVGNGVLHSVADFNMKTFQLVWKIDKFAIAIRSLGLVWSSGYLLRELASKTSVLPLSISKMNERPLSYALRCWVGLIGVGVAGGLVVKGLNRLHLSQLKMEKLEKLAENDETLRKALKKVTVSWQKPSDQLLSQWISILQSTVNIALAIFSKDRLTFTLLGVINLYTLYKTTKRDWLSITKTTSFNDLSLRFTYQPIFMQDHNSSPTDLCSICLEVKDKVFYFCPNHSYHQACLTSGFITPAADFQSVNPLKRASYRLRYGGEIVQYSVYAQRSILPSCPECRNIPSQNELKVDVRGPKEQYPGKISWLDYQVDQKITVQVTKLSTTDSSAQGKLDNETIVFFPQFNPALAGKQVQGKINSIFVNEGTLVLLCALESV